MTYATEKYPICHLDFPVADLKFINLIFPMFMIAFLKILDVQIVIPTKVYIQWLTVIVEVVAVFVMVVAIL